MILETVIRNVLGDALDAEVNTGAGTATFVIETNADVEIATINLQNPAFGASVAGVITLQGVPLSDVSATGGTAAQASIFDRDTTKQWEMTLGTSGTEIIISSVNISATDQVDLNSLTITVPTGP